jgi:hypothetical protein
MVCHHAYPKTILFKWFVEISHIMLFYLATKLKIIVRLIFTISR